MIRLKDRISELHHEIEDAKDNFKLLHKERAQLLKDRESKELETQNWKNKCLDLQMLKFGREIDLDELETFSDRTKELEVESLLEQDRERFELECQKLMKEVASAKEELVAVRCIKYEIKQCDRQYFFTGYEREYQASGRGCATDEFKNIDCKGFKCSRTEFSSSNITGGL